MNQDWQNFLATQGAQIQDGVVSHFGNAPAERLTTRDSTVLCDLGQFGTLRVSGEEAQSFLQNLLSNDIHEVSSTRAQLSSLNTAKGRMLATMLIWREGGDYLLQLPRVLCEPIRKKLSMYVLRAKVKITDASDEIISLGLSGENAQELIRARFGEHPQSPFGCVVTAQGSAIRISDTRWQINTSAAHAATLWQALRQNAQPVGSVCWDWLNIRSGIPVILPQTQEQFVAQMVNLELIGGVNFKKGCYPGQEIVARMQYLGKLKRRMFLAHHGQQRCAASRRRIVQHRHGRPGQRHDRQRSARSGRRLRCAGIGTDFQPRYPGNPLEITARCSAEVSAAALSAAPCLSTISTQE